MKAKELVLKECLADLIEAVNGLEKSTVSDIDMHHSKVVSALEMLGKELLAHRQNLPEVVGHAGMMMMMSLGRMDDSPISEIHIALNSIVDNLGLIKTYINKYINKKSQPRHVLVTRHEGAKQWMEARNIRIDEVWSALNLDEVKAGDVVYGTLPLHLVAEVCARKARFVALVLDIPRHLRGQEYSAEKMAEFNGRLEEYSVTKITEQCALTGGDLENKK